MRSSSRRGRSLLHLGVIALIALALWLSERDGARRAFPEQPPPATPTRAPVQTATLAPSSTRPVASATPLPTATPSPTRASLLHTLQRSPLLQPTPSSSARLTTYTVRAGDSPESVAARFNLQRETIVWANPELEADPNMMYVGQVLTILPMDGVLHRVEQGETLTEIARTYQVPVEAIVNYEYNGKRSSEIAPGERLIVPGGVKPYKPYFVRFEVGTIDPVDPPETQGFIWPVSGDISQGYWNLHRAIDLAGDHGDQVVAADAGTVVYASWESSGYGNLVIVDHGNGFTTYYAHLYGFYVNVGQSIQRGDFIGVRGNTGRSTGPHLHFEIRQNGTQLDPLEYLPDS